jgi:hypothetical protein
MRTGVRIRTAGEKSKAVPTTTTKNVRGEHEQGLIAHQGFDEPADFTRYIRLGDEPGGNERCSNKEHHHGRRLRGREEDAIQHHDRKSLLALRGVAPESEAESVRFHGRRVTKVGPEVKQLPPEGWGPLNKGCERRTRALPDVSVWRRTPRPVRCRSRGRGRRATDRGSFRPAGRCRNARTPPLARARDGAGCAR